MVAELQCTLRNVKENSAPNVVEWWRTHFPDVISRYSQSNAGVSAVDTVLPAGEYSGPPVSEELVIYHTLSPVKISHCDLGAGSFKKKVYHENQMVIVCPNASPSHGFEKPFLSRTFGLPLPLLSKVIEEVSPQSGATLDFGHLHTTGCSNPFILQTLEQIWSEVAQPWLGSRLLIESGIVALALALLKEAQIKATVAGRGGLASNQLRLVLDAMEGQLGEDMSLSMLAGIAGVSPTHLSRAFKQSIGKSPFRWLSERRIHRAKELMIDPQMSLAQVALSVGFSAQAQFSTAFLRVTGSTPREWRKASISSSWVRAVGASS